MTLGRPTPAEHVVTFADDTRVGPPRARPTDLCVDPLFGQIEGRAAHLATILQQVTESARACSYYSSEQVLEQQL